MNEKKWQERKPADVVELWQELYRQQQEIAQLRGELLILRTENEFTEVFNLEED